MLAYTISGPLGATDVVGQVCSKLDLGSDYCDAIRLLLELKGVDPNKVVAEALAKGREQFKTWVGDLLKGQDSTVIAGAKFAAGKIWDKVQAWAAKQAGVTQSPTAPTSTGPRIPSYLITAVARPTQAVVMTDRAATTPASAAGNLLRQPMTWAVVGGVAVVGIAAFLLLRK